MAGVLRARVDDVWVDIPQIGGDGGVAAYTHTQSTPSMTWVIDHGLAFNPGVTVVDSSDRQVEGDVAYSLGQVIVTFSAAFSGKAFLS